MIRKAIGGKMSDFPAWLAGLIGTAAGGFCTLAVGWFSARATKDVSAHQLVAAWGEQLRKRVDSLEVRLEEERRNCEERIRAIVAAHHEEVRSRNETIERLEARIDSLMAGANA